jgi:hypothetical protein
MKKMLFSVIMAIICISLSAQRKANIGIATGTASYMGDINPGRLFYSPSVYFGGIYRYNFNKRFAIRLNGFYTDLSGNINDFPDNNNYQLINSEFNVSLLDIATQIEFNFSPYMPNAKPFTGSFYVAGGIGYTILFGGEVTYIPEISFGAGYKLTITKRISSGLEYSIRRTFSDGIDNAPPEEYLHESLLHNNDYYNFMGIFITYKFINFAVDCPTYD